jgi:hypothetical protein
MKKFLLNQSTVLQVVVLPILNHVIMENYLMITVKILFITCNKKYGYPDDDNPIIYFYDAYNENFKLEALLKQY